MLHIDRRQIESNIRVFEAAKMAAVEGLQTIMDRNEETGEFDVDGCLDMLAHIEGAQKRRHDAKVLILVAELRRASDEKA